MNSYVLFAATITNLTEKESSWLDAVLRNAETAANQGVEIESGLWPDFGFAFDDDDSTLRLYSEGSGDAEQVTCLAQAFLAKFCPDEGWGLEWAYTCDRLVPGQFGGGWAYVTATRIAWGSTSAALRAARTATGGK